MTDSASCCSAAATARSAHMTSAGTRGRADRGHGRDGYPGAYARGSEIRGLEAAAAVDGVTVFHAGTRIEDGRVLANGGRVLNVTAQGATLGQARDRAYAAVDQIDWPDGFCRRDIGFRALGPGA